MQIKSAVIGPSNTAVIKRQDFRIFPEDLKKDICGWKFFCFPSPVTWPIKVSLHAANIL